VVGPGERGEECSVAIALDDAASPGRVGGGAAVHERMILFRP